MEQDWLEKTVSFIICLAISFLVLYFLVSSIIKEEKLCNEKGWVYIQTYGSANCLEINEFIKPINIWQ